MGKCYIATATIFFAGCAQGQPALQELLQQTSGRVELPAGVVEVSTELRLPEGANNLEIAGSPKGTILRAADGFHGRAVLVIQTGKGVTLRNFRIDGNRRALEKPIGLPPSDVAFVDYYDNNGILASNVRGLTISEVELTNITNFPVLVARSQDVLIDGIRVSDSGSRNEKGRNNTSGGVLLEEGCAGFTVRNSVFENVLGNGVWTHSMYTSPRNSRGIIEGNRFRNIARDAIQVGHALNIAVTENRGERIGYPVEAIDVENAGIPVAIDTAGNVSESVYRQNSFEEINGKCIDLDGFHHGSIIGNTCVNRGAAADYVFGHYGIVMNNTNPDMQSEEITIARNVIDGTKFGGIFVIGRRNTVVGNRLLNLNKAGCNESAEQFGCAHFPGEPDLLQSGIYLGQRAERPAVAIGNVIDDNEISGHMMAARCIGYAPGVSPGENRVGRNRCANQEE